jgi:cytochrome c553
MDLRSRLALVTFALLAGCGQTDRSSTDRLAATGELVALSGGDAGAANACIACHGVDGRGDGAGAPRLAGLDRGYLESQLQAYADGRREHPEMHWIANRLRPEQRQSVSAYYAALPFTPREQAMPTDSAAAKLYQQGDPARGLASCASCHGARGEGLGPANPPLAGQSAAYIAEQLERWRSSKRRNDPENAMLRISRALSRPESSALADYAAALPGGPPRPESPAASPPAHRADPRNDASAPRRHGAE